MYRQITQPSRSPNEIRSKRCAWPIRLEKSVMPTFLDGIERASSDGRDGHARHAHVDVGIVIDRKHLRLARIHVPYPRRLVARARDDERAVVREVERVDFLLVAFGSVPNAFSGDVPYLCRFSPCTSVPLMASNCHVTTPQAQRVRRCIYTDNFS